jgi:hypothetical protein
MKRADFGLWIFQSQVSNFKSQVFLHSNSHAVVLFRSPTERFLCPYAGQALPFVLIQKEAKNQGYVSFSFGSQCFCHLFAIKLVPFGHSNKIAQQSFAPGKSLTQNGKTDQAN